MEEHGCTEIRLWAPPAVQRLDHSAQLYAREWAQPEGGDIRRLGYMAWETIQLFSNLRKEVHGCQHNRDQ